MIRDLVQGRDFIEFAILFGSFARKKETPVSDVDLDIFVSSPIDLLTLGRLSSDLERMTRRNVDILVLNEILDRSPKIAYQVVASGRLIACRNPKGYVDFKTQAILRFLDTAYLRDTIDEAFLERVRNNTVGDRAHD